jgi:Mannosylglycerate hydrolase MGH1-like glycoside hydrolase domain
MSALGLTASRPIRSRGFRHVHVLTLLIISTIWCTASAQNSGRDQSESHERLAHMEKRLATGWNTWNTFSVMSQVLLPEGLAVNLELRDPATGQVLASPLIGRRGNDVESIRPGPHSYDGSYTDLTITWHGFKARIQSAHAGNDDVVLVTPDSGGNIRGELIVRPEILWKRQGAITMEHGCFKASMPRATVNIYADCGPNPAQPNGDSMYAAFSLSDTIGISTGVPRSISRIVSVVDSAGEALEQEKGKYGTLKVLYDAMQTVLAWNVIYSPTLNMVIVPVSRLWNVTWKGWVLFDWDTYFSAYMLSLSDKDLAYSNAIAVTDQITPGGFIPNFGSGLGRSDDRSEPPVGAYFVSQIYKKYRDKWFLEEVFPNLLAWNRWWDKSRQFDGFLCWGSTPYKFPADWPSWLKAGVNASQGAKWESGLDNSPMYDDAVYDTTRHLMMLGDVGLISLYVTDCKSLAEIAAVLGKPAVARELLARAEKYAKALQSLWDDKSGLFLNKRLDDGRFSHRLSPTLFYPMLAGVATQGQVDTMMQYHFYNPKEFWGEWIIPSIARDDSAFKDNDYWRGRIWAPMNFLVYLGMRNYCDEKARDDLVAKSRELLFKSWLDGRHVFENYNSVTGQGDDVQSSDKFYHWGALLGFMSFIEEGYVPPPELPLR